jgi:peroxiredoxin Q/BCP
MFADETQKQPTAGTPAPDFSLTTSEGSQASLKDYRGKWVVLYFYPKDFTSGCTLEAKNFQRDLAKYDHVGLSSSASASTPRSRTKIFARKKD